MLPHQCWNYENGFTLKSILFYTLNWLTLSVTFLIKYLILNLKKKITYLFYYEYLFHMQCNVKLCLTQNCRDFVCLCVMEVRLLSYNHSTIFHRNIKLRSFKNLLFHFRPNMVVIHLTMIGGVVATRLLIPTLQKKNLKCPCSVLL